MSATTTATLDPNAGAIAVFDALPANTALPDLVWQNTNGLLYDWQLSGTTIAGSGAIGTRGTGWQLLGIGDFEGNGNNDLLRKNTATGLLYEWQMTGTQVTGGGAIGTIGSNWRLLGIGDFQGTGDNDLLWQDTNFGLLYEWQMTGSTIAGSGAVGTLNSNWQFLGIGDFLGAGNNDVLWRDTVSGLVYDWHMNGTAVAGSTAIGTLGSPWQLLGTGDFQGTGNNDLLWDNTATGLLYEWQMNGTTIAGSGAIATLDSTWKFLGIGGFDGAGKGDDDVLWQDSATGLIYEWQLNGTLVAASGAVGTLDSGWTLLGLGQFGTASVAGLSIAGTKANQQVVNGQSIQPFATVSVIDGAVAQGESATITLAAAGTATDVDGVLSGADLSKTGIGTYVLTEPSAAALTTALGGLVFTPTPASGAPVTTGFTLAVTDAAGSSASDGATSVTVNAGTVNPTISGAIAGQTLVAPGSIQLFASVTIADANVGQTETVSVSLSDYRNGVLSNLGGGTYDAASAIWTDTGSAAQVTAALDGLLFTPAIGRVPGEGSLATKFTIDDQDSLGASTRNAVTTVFAQASTIGTTALVEAGYYDLEPSYGNTNALPSPWIGAANTTFDGNAALAQSADPDEAALLIVNIGAAPLVLTAATLSYGGHTLSLWTSYIGAGQTVLPGANLILSGTMYSGSDSNMDGSEFALATGTLTATINGTDVTAVDTTGILGGFLPTGYDETLPWTQIGLAVTCFAEGTLIRTASGDVPVERLGEGDLVMTAEGRPVKVQWVGRRWVDCRAHPRPELVWPVRVAAGAFGRLLPERDLFLSPGHAVHVDGVLVPVSLLIDGDTIAQVPRDVVTYYHVELAAHALILAEGLEVESYLDSGNRRSFENGGGPVSLFPDFAPVLWEARGCAPLAVAGKALAMARAERRRRVWRGGAHAPHGRTGTFF